MNRDAIIRKIQHLSEDELKNLTNDYYTGVPMTEMSSKYNIKGIPLGDLHYGFAPIKHKEIKCRFCNEYLFTYRKARKPSRFNYSEKEFCITCGHENSERCQCANCINEKSELQKKENENKIASLSKIINMENYKPIDFDVLTLRQKVFIGVFLRGLISDDFQYLKPISNCNQKLFPTEELLKTAFDELMSNNIITIHPKSSIDFFNIEGESFSYFWKDVYLHVNIKSNISRDVLISIILNPGIYPDIYSEKILEIWKEIIYHESLELFIHRMQTYNFNYKIGKETKAFFNDLINYFPISQIYAIIYYGAKDAAAFFQEGKVIKNQAANSVLQRMRNAADKTIAGQWPRRDFNRPKECQQSMLSEYFFNSILKICDQGWGRIPCVITKIEDNINSD